jgi:5-carboxymethyl-2-hydroxymuconate isomerase
MPHLVVEYSSNLDDEIDIQELVNKVHQAALASGVFELAAVRTRAERRDVYAIADGHPDNSFVAIHVNIATGRDVATRQRLGREIFDVTCNYLESVPGADALAISLEVREIDPTAAFRKNKLHSLVKERAAKAPV